MRQRLLYWGIRCRPFGKVWRLDMSSNTLNEVLGNDLSTFDEPIPRKKLKKVDKRVDDHHTRESFGGWFKLEEVNSFGGDTYKYRDEPFKGSGNLVTIKSIDGEELDLAIGYYDDEYWYPAEEAARAFIQGYKMGLKKGENKD